MSVPSSELGPPTPSLASECGSTPRTKVEGRQTRLPGGGCWGGPNSDEGTETLVLYVFYIPLRYFCTKCTERRFLIHVSEVNQMHNEEEFRICNNALMLNLLNTPLTNCNNVHNENVTINFCFFFYFWILWKLSVTLLDPQFEFISHLRKRISL